MKLDYIIEISDDDSRKARRQGVVKPRIEDEIWRRRVRDPRINFWDLGMVSTGPAYNEWSMLDFQPSIPGSFENSASAFDSTYHDELLAKIFEVDVENWSTYYKRIVPAMDYGIVVEARNDASGAYGVPQTLDNANTNFTNAGLKIDDPQWFTGGYLPWVNYSDGSSLVTFSITPLGESVINHITTEYDINAAAADFTPSTKMDVFLVPSLPQMRGRLSYTDSGTTYTQQLNDFFHLYDRGIFLTPSNPMYYSGQFVTGSNLGLTGGSGEGIYDSDIFARFTAIKEYMQAFDGARARYSTDLGATWPTSDDGSSFAGIVPNPYPTFPPNGIGYGANVNNFVRLLAGNSNAFNGNPVNQTRLRCVIKQAGVYYYVWNISYT